MTATATEADQDLFVARLQAAVRRALPGADVRALRRLTGGASLQTWSFEAVVGAGAGEETHRLILRRLPAGQAPLMNSVPLGTEAAAIMAARQGGVPVAAVRCVLTPDDGLGEGFVCDFVEGETVPRRILRDPPFARLRDTLAAQSGAVLARLHALRVDAPLAVLTAEEQIASIARSYRSRPMRSPVFDYAIRWLGEHMPEPPARPRLVHGDFRMGNLLVAPDAIRAVLDWELVHLGDPAEDLGWLTVNSWRFGAIDKPVAGVGQVEDLMAAYVAAGGEPIASERIRFWRALGSLRWGVGCGEMADAFARGADHAVERGMIGRRVSETEVDLLDIMAPKGLA